MGSELSGEIIGRLSDYLIGTSADPEAAMDALDAKIPAGV